MGEKERDSESAGPTEPAPPNLALIRTDLANERTVLAYGRTAFMLVGTGVSLIKFLNVTHSFILIGWAIVIVGAVVGAIGMVRFTSLKRRLDRVRNGHSS